MLLAIHGLPDDYTHVRHQILDFLMIIVLSCSILLRVPGKHTTDIPINHVDDSSALVSQGDDHTFPCKMGKGHHKCDHCGKLGHKIDRCYALHVRIFKLNIIKV